MLSVAIVKITSQGFNLLPHMALKQPSLNRKQGLAWRTRLGLSWNKHRKQRQFCRSPGIQFDSERAERILEKENMCGDIKIKNVALISADKSIHLTTPVGIIGDDDLPSFVSKLLDQYDEE